MKYKVITINGFTSANLDGNSQFNEVEHPLLNKYLDKGWKVNNVYPITTQSAGEAFAVVFILTLV